MHIYFSLYLVLIITSLDVIGVKFSDNIATFISPSYHNTQLCNLFAKRVKIRHGIPSDGKKFTLEDLIQQNILPQPPVFDNDPGYNRFHKIDYKSLARKHLKLEQQRIARLDQYFNDSSKQYTLTELLNILNEHGIYPYMSISTTIEMLNRFKYAIHNYISVNNYLCDELVDLIHKNRGFLRIIGSIRRCMKILKRVIVREALLDDPKIKKSLPQFKNSDIVDIFEVLSLTRYKNDILITLLINYVEDHLKNFTINQLCNIVYHISKLKYSAIGIVKNLTSRVTELTHLSPHDSLLVSEALVSFDYVQKDVFDKLADDILNGIEDFEVKELIRLFKTFTSAEYINDDFYTRVTEAISNNLDKLDTASYVMDLLSSLSHMNMKISHLLDFISVYINTNFSSFSPTQLASISKYLAMLHCYPKELFKKIFSLPIFSVIPDMEVMNHIRMGYHKNNSYTAYLHKYPFCELDKLYNKIFIAYKSYHLESSATDKDQFKFTEKNERNLRDIFLYQSREKIFTSSSIHLEIADIYRNQFNINFHVGFPSDEGFLIDLAYVTDDGDKFAIKVNGPFHFMQRCLSQIPPPLTASSMFKERLLKKMGWIVSNINYWDYATWFPFEKKKCTLFNALPDKLKELCNKNVVETCNTAK